MKSLFESQTHQDIINRVDTLNENTTGNWGKMNVGQMLWHCQGRLKIFLQKEAYGMKPSWFAKLFFKKSLYNEKGWRKNLPTAKFLKTNDQKDFNAEKIILMNLINEAHACRDTSEFPEHPAFGYFTAQQWGQMQYKHLDYHLTQFGV